MAEFVISNDPPFLLYPATQKQAVIVNHDEENDIAIGSQEGIYSFQPSGVEGGQITDPTVTIVAAAGGQIVVDGTWAVYGVCIPLVDNSGNIIDSTANVSVTEGATSLLPGANETAAALISSGFITEMATALQLALATGAISLLANPTLLYNQGIQNPAIPGVTVGATTLAAGYGATNKVNAVPVIDGFVGRPIAATAQKWYLQEGDTLASIQAQNSFADYTGLQALGVKFTLCVKPSRHAAKVGGSTLTAEQANLTAILNALTPHDVILWQECNQPHSMFFSDTGDATQPSYLTYWDAYQPTITGLGYKCCYDPLLFDLVNSITMYPHNGQAKHPDKVYCDWYGQDFNNNRNPDTVQNGKSLVSMAATDGVPLGIGEWGESAQGKAITQAQLVNMTNKCIAIIQGQINAGFTTANNNDASVMWYSGGDKGGVPGPNDVLGPPPDINAVALQTSYDALAPSAGSLALTIGPNSFKTVTPLAPSPGAGFALTNGLSYEITINAIAGVGSTNPWLQAQVNWHTFDSTAGHTSDAQHWSIPMGVNGSIGSFVIGRGPMCSEYVSILLHNYDTVGCTVAVSVLQTGRSEKNHDLIWDTVNSVAIPTFTSPGGNTYSKSLGSVNGDNIPASGNKQYLMSMYAGNATIRVVTDTHGSTGMLNFVLHPQPPNLFGSGAIFNVTTDDTEVFRELILPRGPCLLTVSNGNAAGVKAFVEMVAGND